MEFGNCLMGCGVWFDDEVSCMDDKYHFVGSVYRNLNGQQMDKKRKTIIKISKDIGFSIDVQTNLKEVDFFF